MGVCKENLVIVQERDFVSQQHTMYLVCLSYSAYATFLYVTIERVERIYFTESCGLLYVKYDISYHSVGGKLQLFFG